MKWSKRKPVTPGAYWIKGNGLQRPALIEVVYNRTLELLECNLHMRNSEIDFGYGYAIGDLNEKFRYCGPLVPPS